MPADTSRQRLFFTFAATDLGQAAPVAARLLAGGGLALDQALTSEPFTGVRGDIIRASLLTRLKRCTGTLCLYGAHTLDDDWVRWALASAAELRLPLLGAALPGEDCRASERILAGLGAEFVPLRAEAIAAKAREVSPRRPPRRVDAASIAETLHLMRHQLR